MKSGLMNKALQQAKAEMPTADIVQAINALLAILGQRGIKLKDFDNKDRTLHKLRSFGNKACLLFSEDQKEAKHGDESKAP